MIDSSVEEALEILYVHEMEHGRRHSEPAAEGAMEEAARLGLVRNAGGVYQLTEAGREMGRDVIRRHRLAECLLKDVLSVSPEYIDEDACRFEHILQHGLDEKICVLLGHPKECPHGRPIPPGACCQSAQADRIVEVGPLCDGRPGATGVVAYLATRDSRQVQKMMAMGILPGIEIHLIQRSPSYVFQIGYSQFAVDRPLASVIYVHWKPAEPKT